MADENTQSTEKSDMRAMWIMTAVIVLFIVGLAGWNMLSDPNWMHGGVAPK